MLLSQNKIAGVSHILAVALCNGASPTSISAKLNRAISGTYVPQSGWSDRELCVAFLVKAIGGPRLLYTLQKAEAYPSLSTLQKHKPIPGLLVSLNTPSTVDFKTNITAFLGDMGRPPPEYYHPN